MSNWPNAPAMRYEAHYGDRVARCFASRPKGVDQILRDTVALRPDAEALVDNGRRFTYAEFDRMVDAVAAGRKEQIIAALLLHLERSRQNTLRQVKVLAQATEPNLL